MMNIVIFGAPGSGKGTQSERIIASHGLLHISTGDVLRDHIRRGTPLGATAKTYMDKGQLLPDELIIDILAQVLDDNAGLAGRGVIFDGFPRTIAQADALERLLADRGTAIHAVVGLEVPDEVLTERILLRAQQAGRADDTPDVVRNRLEVYHRQTAPLQDYYRQRGLYHAIEGTGTVDGIAAVIAKTLDTL